MLGPLGKLHAMPGFLVSTTKIARLPIVDVKSSRASF